MEREIKQILSRILNVYATVGSTAVDLIFENGSVETSKKNELVFQEKRFNAFEYFQLDGVSHRFNIDGDSQKITTGIYQNEVVITPHFTRTINGQSIFSIQALTDCTFLKVPAGTFRDISEKNQQIRMFGRAVVEQEFIRSLNFEVQFRSCNAKDRLLYFRNTYPFLENIIPHTIISSFLGITPVSFSRLRNEFSKK
ncbi:MAG: Crp/Fnr family transcriptional regulator [Flavitalea sp.]